MHKKNGVAAAILRFFLLFGFYSAILFAQESNTRDVTETMGTFEETSIVKINGQNELYSVKFKVPGTNNYTTSPAGVIGGTINGKSANFYCIDYFHPLGGKNHIYWDKQYTPSEVSYVLNNYYPYKSDYVTSRGDDDDDDDSGKIKRSIEIPAVQLVIWHYMDGVDLNTIKDKNIRQRALEIKSTVDANSTGFSPVITLEIIPVDFDVYEGQQAKFKVLAKDHLNGPVSNVAIKIYSDSDGILNGIAQTINLSTDQNGETTVVSLSQGSSEKAKISAEAEVIMPHGTIYVSRSEPDARQKIVLSTPKEDLKKVDAEVTWKKGSATIGDFVWEDTDLDGIQDANESGLENVIVKLYTCQDVLVKETTTNSNGFYQFANVTPGEYFIKFAVPSNYVDYKLTVKDQDNDNQDSDADPATGKTDCFVLNNGDNNTSIDAGFFLNKSYIGDFVWKDENKNGVQDAGEAGFEGVTVKLYDCNGQLIQSTKTDADGLYKFYTVPGDYKIKVISPAEYKFSLKSQGTDITIDSDINENGYSDCVTLLAGQGNVNVDAGLYLNKSSFSSKVWEDKDKDGVQDPNEDGIKDVLVYLLDCNDNLIKSVQTDANGNFNFTEIISGEYKLKIEFPLDYIATKQDNASNDEIDSDINGNGYTECFTLEPGENTPHIDAGLLVDVASLGDYVWVDANGNGIQENGEIGIKDVEIKLYDDKDQLTKTTNTDAAGKYLFQELKPGNYYVNVSLPVNYKFTLKDSGNDDEIDSDVDENGKSTVVTLAAGENNLKLDAGLVFKYTSLGDFIWNDKNKNGIQDQDEKGIAGVNVKLLDCDGTLVKTTTTDEGGKYTFEKLTPGDYKIEVELKNDYKFSAKKQGADDNVDSDIDPVTGQSECITLAADETNLSIDVAMYHNLASLGDKVWFDKNKDGVQNDEEEGLANVEVKLFDSSNNEIATTSTSEEGEYLFENLVPGDYKVKFIIPANYKVTNKNSGSDDDKDSDADNDGNSELITLIAGENNLSIDAGMYINSASVGDLVWLDANKNGIQDTDEKGKAGITVKLFNCDDQFVKSVVTDENGKFLFTELIPGDYKIKVIAPADYKFTQSKAGNDNSKDSDVDAVTGTTECFTVQAGSANVDVDAGLVYKYTSLGDFIWNDKNHDGIQNQDEEGLASVTVELLQCDGTLVKSVVTNENGFYKFEQLIPGEYKVKVTAPDNYEFSEKDQGSDNTADSDVDPVSGESDCITLTADETNLTLDAGLYLDVANITGKVWVDADRDGIQDGTEKGIKDVSVELYDCSKNFLIQTVPTNENGVYLFTNVPSGKYYVKIVNSDQYEFTEMNQGDDDTKDSDADKTTGQTECIDVVGGTDISNIDAGLISNAAETNLEIVKTVSKENPDNGENVIYTITVTNIGTTPATGIEVTDILPESLVYVTSTASQGLYEKNSGIWTVGTLTENSNATLEIEAMVSIDGASSVDLGPAKGYNVFVLGNMTYNTSDTQGKVAVGNTADLAGHSIGDQLEDSNGQVDVLIVGNHLESIGDTYAGNVVYGNTHNLPSTYQNLIRSGTLRKDKPIDFAAAESYLLDLTDNLAKYETNGTVKYQGVNTFLEGKDALINVFEVDGDKINNGQYLEVNAPNGSVVIVNFKGNNILWKGGLEVKGTVKTNVIYNFPEATEVQIKWIDVRGTILAPRADVNFISGVQNGQMIAKNLTGGGQYNHSYFIGNIPGSKSIINYASITKIDQTDSDLTNNEAQVKITVGGDAVVIGDPNDNTQKGSWEKVDGIPTHEVVWTMHKTETGQLFAGVTGGRLYTMVGDNWSLINTNLSVAYIWSIVSKNNTLYIGTEKGVFESADNGTTWISAGLENKDVRALAFDLSGKLYAGTWGYGMYRFDGAWQLYNNGLVENVAIHALAVDKASNDIYAGTFGYGIVKLVNGTDTWVQLNNGYDFIWCMGITDNGEIYAGTYGKGVLKSGDNGLSWQHYSEGLDGIFVYSMAVTGNDVLVTTWAGGVYELNKNDGVLNKVVPGDDNWVNVGLGGQGVSYVYEEETTGVMYAATKEGGFMKFTPQITSVDVIENEIPTEFALNQNYPNPFNPATTIEFDIAQDGNYKLVIFSTLGKEVKVLVDDYLSVGKYKATFEAGELSSGMYIYRLSGNNKVVTKKMLLLK